MPTSTISVRDILVFTTWLLALGAGQLGADDSAAPRTAGASKPAVELAPTVRARCFEVLREGLRSDEFWPAMHAAEALTLAGRGDEVKKLLAPKLPEERDAQRRCGLARELVRAGDREKTAVMLEILAEEDDYGHTHAAESLFKAGEIGDGRLLRDAMRREGNPKLQIMAAAALARDGDTAAMEFLREQVRHEDLEIARTAAWVLTQIGDGSDLPDLREGLKRADDPLTRCYFINALAALGDAEGKRMLQTNLRHSDPAVRTYAANFAGDAGVVSAIDDLARLLDDATLDVRIRAAQALLTLAAG
jgi:sialidase-1